MNCECSGRVMNGLMSDRQHGEERIELQRREQHRGRVHGDGHHFAVREIHHSHHAEDHRQPERHQPVHQARQNAGDDDVRDEFRSHDKSGSQL
jgi:hypothetical protein